MKLVPLKDKIFGEMIDTYGERTTSGGIIVVENDGEAASIRPRWFCVTHIGSEQKDIQIGDYVLIPHGRWSRKIKLEEQELFNLDAESVLLVSEENPIK